MRAVRDAAVVREVDFGRPLYISKVYEAIEALPGRSRRDGHAVPAHRSGRRPRPSGAARSPPIGERLPLPVLRALRAELEPDGRIEIGELRASRARDARGTATEVEVR